MPSPTIGILAIGACVTLMILVPADLLAQHADWVVKSPMPTAREKLATCAIGPFIYAIGGAVGDNSGGLTINERYDTVTDVWLRLSGMPTGRRDLVAAAVDGKCYAIGGHENFGTQALSVVEVYDPDTDSWSTGASLPSGRLAPAAAAIDGLIYVAGGFTGNSTPVDSLLVYDPIHDSWTKKASMSTARAGLAAAALDGKLYALGGSNAPAFNRQANLEVYDPAADRWTSLANMPVALAILAAEAVDGNLYAMGGAPIGLPVPDVNVYSPASNSWSAGPALTVARNRHASAVVDDTIYVIGGSQSLAAPHPGIDVVEALGVSSSGFEVNAGISDAWYDPATDGQGFFIIVLSDVELMFLAWFTFDTVRPPQDVSAILGEPGHRWITAQGPFVKDAAFLDLVVTRGGVFDTGDPRPENSIKGTMEVRFESCTAGAVTYEIPGLDLSGEVPIQRIVDDRVELCEALGSGN